MGEKKSSGNSSKDTITDSFANSTLSAMNVSKTDYPQVESKKRVNEYNAEAIYDAVQRYKISDVNLSNLQKLHERELINVPFFQKLRKIFTSNMIKSHLMEVLGISKSYTGFHEYIKGDREDIPNAGLCNIAKKVGYNIMTIPVPENITEAEYRSLCAYRDGFIFAVENRVKEGNVPVTRAKPSSKDRQLYVNQDLLSGLALNQESIIDSIKTDFTGEKIDVNDVFVDDSEPLNTLPFENTQRIQQMSNEDIDNINIGGSLGSIDDFENLSSINLNSIGMFNDTGMTDMTGFVDNFEGFNTIGDDDLDEMELAVLNEKASKKD